MRMAQGVVGFTLSVVAASAAQAQAQTPMQAEQEPFTVDEVVVTAQRRAQTLRDVPIAVTAIDGDRLEAAGVRDLKDLQILVPSLTLTQTNSEEGGTSIRIRGVGTSGNNAGLEAAVGVFLDGVYRSRSGVAMGDLIDIARIEVLRGPQGTLFGRNTSSGAITVTTRGPEFTRSAFIQGTLANYDGRKVDAMVTGPLSDTLAFRLNVGASQRDGFFDDVVTGATYNDRDRYNLRGQLLYRPSDDASLRVIADYARRDEACCVAAFSVIGPTSRAAEALGAVFPTLDPYDRQVALDRPIVSDGEDAGLSAELVLSRAWGQLTAITAYRDFSSTQAYDFDYGSADIAYAPNAALNVRLISQEVRLNGQSGRLDWLVGGYVAGETIDREDSRLFGADLAPLFRVPAAFLPAGQGSLSERYRQESFNASVFTHNTVVLSDLWSLTAGLRLTYEEKEATGAFVTNSPGCPALPLLCRVPDFDVTTEETEVSGVINLAYRLAERTRTYVSYSRGYKGGGVNLQRESAVVALNNATLVGDPTFEPEFADSFEAGLKTELFARRLSVNLAAFYTRFTDFQSLRFVNGITSQVINAPSAVSRGVEVDASARLASWLAATLSVGYVDAAYGDDLVDSMDPIIRSLADRRIENAPLWTLSSSLDAERNLSDGLKLTASASARYQSSTITASDPSVPGRQAAYTLVNARVGLWRQDDRLGLEVWANNLFDADYHTLSFPVPVQAGTLGLYLGDRRTYGVTLKAGF